MNSIVLVLVLVVRMKISEVMLPRPKVAMVTKQSQHRASWMSGRSLSPSRVPFSTPKTLFHFQAMAESYTSRTTDVSGNGYPNSSQPSLVPAQTASNIIRKKLMGYVGFANLPNQVHRKSVRKGFQFTTMVVGASTRA